MFSGHVKKFLQDISKQVAITMDSDTEELLIYDRDLSSLIEYFEYSILGRKKPKKYQ